MIERYPEPSDPIELVVYEKSTGTILRHVKCTLENAHRQHEIGHGYLELPLGTKVDVNDMVVDVQNKQLATRTVPKETHLHIKRVELDHALRDKLHKFTSSATGQPLEYKVDLPLLQLVCMVGGELETSNGLVNHTAEQAKQVVIDFMAHRSAAHKRHAQHHKDLEGCKTLTALKKIKA